MQKNYKLRFSLNPVKKMKIKSSMDMRKDPVKFRGNSEGANLWKSRFLDFMDKIFRKLRISRFDGASALINI